jgi:hypothetical protein
MAMSELERHTITMMSRALRLGVICNLVHSGHITIEEAKEALAENLTSGDDSTFYDDSADLEKGLSLKGKEIGPRILFNEA